MKEKLQKNIKKQPEQLQIHYLFICCINCFFFLSPFFPLTMYVKFINKLTKDTASLSCVGKCYSAETQMSIAIVFLPLCLSQFSIVIFFSFKTVISSQNKNQTLTLLTLENTKIHWIQYVSWSINTSGESM